MIGMSALRYIRLILSWESPFIKNHVAKNALAMYEMVVAQAAPASPISSQMIKIGSKIIFTTAGIMIVSIAILGYPSARITLLLIIAHPRNGTPSNTILK